MKEIAVFLMSCFSVSCALHTSDLKPIAHEQSAYQVRILGQDLADGLVHKVKFRDDRVTIAYLGKVSEKLIDSNPVLRNRSLPATIWIVEDIRKKWLNFALPGNRIYLSLSLLKTLHYENEVAALIALQLAHIHRKSLINRISRPTNPKQPGNDKYTEAGELDYFGAHGIFAFARETEILAMQEAVGILYASGYDARGLISICDRYLQNPRYSPYESSTLKKLIEETRHQIALFAPLRNPIVRSEDFINIRKRINQL